MAKAVRKVTVASVNLWGNRVGAVAWNPDRRLASFEFDPKFIAGNLPVAPLTMPLRRQIYSFPGLPEKTFRGLPGLLADSLPDRFGNKLINLWLQRHGRSTDDFSPVERLCYIGSRGMGALEYEPAYPRGGNASVPIEVAEMVELARAVVTDRSDLLTSFSDRDKAIETIIRVGTSAGGQRAKAVISWNPDTNQVRSGQVPAPQGFQPWILKFDGVRDDALGDPEGFGRVEYAYSRMAAAAGIDMSECRLFHENGRAHFMTRRFDRTTDGQKLHVLTLCGIAHYDFNAPGAYGYESVFQTIHQLNLGYPSLVQSYRRMLFNILARNQDDHTRNIAFLMSEQGEWSLAPAYDVVWAYNPSGQWTSRHQMSVNGKQDGFSLDDVLAPAHAYGIKKAADIVEHVREAVRKWPDEAAAAGVPDTLAETIARSHRVNLI